MWLRNNKREKDSVYNFKEHHRAEQLALALPHEKRVSQSRWDPSAKRFSNISKRSLALSSVESLCN